MPTNTTFIHNFSSFIINTLLTKSKRQTCNVTVLPKFQQQSSITLKKQTLTTNFSYENTATKTPHRDYSQIQEPRFRVAAKSRSVTYNKLPKQFGESHVESVGILGPPT